MYENGGHPATRKRGRPCKCRERGITCRHGTSVVVRSLHSQTVEAGEFRRNLRRTVAAACQSKEVDCRATCKISETAGLRARLRRSRIARRSTYRVTTFTLAA